jgi:hypothetical protein
MRRSLIALVLIVGASLLVANAGSGSPALRWRVVSRSKKQELAAIHRLSRTSVWIAGRDGKLPLVEHWDGRRLVRLPTAPRVATFSDVAPVSARDVWAVGSSPSPDDKPLIEHWDGAAWQSVEFAQPTLPPCADPSFCTADIFELDRLAAVGPQDVWALGSMSSCDINNCYLTLFAEHWNGATWEVVPVAVPVEDVVVVTDMQALPDGEVWAVGYDHEGPGTQVDLVLHWNGQQWTEVRSVFRFVDCGELTLSAVAAVTPRDVWAGGASTAANMSNGGTAPPFTPYTGRMSRRQASTQLRGRTSGSSAVTSSCGGTASPGRPSRPPLSAPGRA